MDQLTTKMGNIAGKATLPRLESTKDLCITYHENGNLRSTGAYPKHVGKSYDGKKEGPFYGYEEDGKTMWLIVTYKKGGTPRQTG